MQFGQNRKSDGTLVLFIGRLLDRSGIEYWRDFVWGTPCSHKNYLSREEIV